jgi:hypothetical protein
MKQTAVEWIEGYLKKMNHIQESLSLRKAFEQAKEMEKEQIRIAYMEGAFEKMRHLEGKEFMMPTEYYQQTFKTK